MIPRDKILLVKRLLEEGMTQRDIARQTGVSRGTVSRVSQGILTVGERHEETSFPKRLDQPTRCPKCGLLVTTDPCIFCYTEAYSEIDRPTKKTGRRRKQHNDDSDPLRIRLRPEHRRRYEEIRRNVENGIRLGDVDDMPAGFDPTFPADDRTDPRR